MEATKFKIGDHCTYALWTDRHAGYIVDVSKSGTKVTFQRGNAVRTDSNGMSECQSYDVSPNPNGFTTEFSLRTRKNGDTFWKRVGTPSKERGDVLFAGHREYYDYSF